MMQFNFNQVLIKYFQPEMPCTENIDILFYTSFT